MKTKPYSQNEEKPIVANEPVVAYGSTPTVGLGYPTEPDNEMLRPFTWEEARKWIAEAEAEDEEGTPAEEFFTELKREFPWLS